MGGSHGPRTLVREGARAIKVSMRCFSVERGYLFLLLRAHGPLLCLPSFEQLTVAVQPNSTATQTNYGL